MIKHKRYLLRLSTLIVVLFAGTGLAAAASKAPVTESYGTNTVIQKGMLVELNPKNSNQVQPLSQDDSDKLLGVVVNSNDAALTLTSNTADRQVYVASFGKYDVLVSNQNGPIKTGDYVTISTLDGVAMKADKDQTIVVGKALSSFDGSSDVEGTASLTRTDGSKLQVALGHISVAVSIQNNPMHTISLPNRVTQILTKIGYSVSGKTVSPVRVYMALLVLLIATVVAVILLYSGVRNAMVSIGRNPLARAAIVRSLVQVVLTSLIIFVIGIFAMYLLLKL